MREPMKSALPVVRLAALGALACLLVACGGGGSPASGNLAPAQNPPPTAGTVTISGRVTFDRVPLTAPGGGLFVADATRDPARGVTVEAIATAGQAVLASTQTDANGRYAFDVASNTSVFLRARAEMRRVGQQPGWNISVRDNVASNAVYVLDGLDASTGAAASVRDLHASANAAPSGVRPAGPFSLLDVVYQAQQLVLGAEPSAVFPALGIYWSVNNLPCDPGAAGFCDGTAGARARGEIGTSFYADIPGQGPSIYVLGDVARDSDEFDQHVIAHEWGHYYQDAFSRDDSLGGAHSLSDRLDLRVAFSEGWGNAFAGMVKGDPVYRDSFGPAGASGFTINVESNAAPIPGWFSEASVQSVTWDVFDAANEPGDTVAGGFAPIHAAMRGPVRATGALTSIYPLFVALRAALPGSTAGLNALALAQSISAVADDFGAGETNAGNDIRNLPIYVPMTAGQVFPGFCSSLPGGSTSAVYNKLGNRRFIRFNLAVGGTVSIAANNGPPGSDPDIVLYSQGTQRGLAEGTASGTETLTQALPAGAYIAEIYEFSNINTAGTPRGTTCFTVQLTVS